VPPDTNKCGQQWSRFFQLIENADSARIDELAARVILIEKRLELRDETVPDLQGKRESRPDRALPRGSAAANIH
jgi:hypothetical protein